MSVRQTPVYYYSSASGVVRSFAERLGRPVYNLAEREHRLSEADGPWAARLEAAVGAIETLRLGLLRMHAQQGEAGALTADLDAARDLAERIDYALAADREVSGLLDQSRHQSSQAVPSPSVKPSANVTRATLRLCRK